MSSILDFLLDGKIGPLGGGGVSAGHIPRNLDFRDLHTEAGCDAKASGPTS